MNIPDKGYDPLVEWDWSSITIYTNTNSNIATNKRVKLPAWLRSIILIKIDQAKEEGRREALAPFRKAFDSL